MMQPDGACENDYFFVPSTARSTYLPNLTILWPFQQGVTNNQ
jgi:hypothetical protein